MILLKTWPWTQGRLAGTGFAVVHAAMSSPLCRSAAHYTVMWLALPKNMCPAIEPFQVTRADLKRPLTRTSKDSSRGCCSDIAGSKGLNHIPPVFKARDGSRGVRSVQYV